jgi:hypothetical protein
MGWGRLKICVAQFLVGNLVSIMVTGAATAGPQPSAVASAAVPPAIADYRQTISPILEDRCYECHGDGNDKGRIAFDELNSDQEILNHDLWLKVLKNTRSGLMPAEHKPRPTAEQQDTLEHWIKYEVFGIDPRNPDPGRVTVRRLNRVEYRNTVHDLLGVDFNSEIEFPPDDSGYGFDNIGDALSVSPMLMEKYIAAAQAIVAEAVPTEEKKIGEFTVPGSQFTSTQPPDGQPKSGQPAGGDTPRKDGKLRMSYYDPATVQKSITVERPGTYRLVVTLDVNGSFEFDPGRCRLIGKLDGKEFLSQEFGYYSEKSFVLESTHQWKPEDHRITFELQPLTPVTQKKNRLELTIAKLVVQGPLEKSQWVELPNYRRFFPKAIPSGRAQRRAYAREILGEFATKAYRRPLGDDTAERLAALAEHEYQQPGSSFELGVAHAMAAVLASPRFLFRLEAPEGASPFAHAALVDEYSLASRLSYFLWSTMPDPELIDLAARGELRKNLHAQVKRMLADPRSEQLAQNFAGQWLQTREVKGIANDALAILARDDGEEKELHAVFDAVRNQGDFSKAPQLRNKFGRPRIQLDDDTRIAMQRETVMFVSSIIHEDRPVTQLIDSDYTFLNDKLAKIYGIPDVNGSDMRRVTLPPDSPRGGVLTEASSLVVTSNPDRTSPVKRGLFVLDNILGTPTPPPPPNVPALEASEKDFKDHEPTLRESLQMHRDKPLCASCHNRMDPIGLAFENFNAMGMWREKERKQPILAQGTLVTGETFNSVSELKHILATQHRTDFYRTLTDKLLTYATGRGTEYYDTETMDQIVAHMQEDGRFSTLLMGVIDSAPFQKMRTTATATVAN